jgi:hypothetical protein
MERFRMRIETERCYQTYECEIITYTEKEYRDFKTLEDAEEAAANIMWENGLELGDRPGKVLSIKVERIITEIEIDLQGGC